MSGRRGIFITFEGLDGCGKTTQLTRLYESLRARGVDTLATREPGGTKVGERIRAILVDSSTVGLSPRAELTLMFADRAQHVKEVIEPALASGKTVLCDRYTDSTEAYQGYGRELGSELVLNLHRELSNNLWPDLTLLLDSDLDASIARARSRNRKTESSEGRFESETAAFFGRVYDGFGKIAQREGTRVVRIPGGSIQSVEAEIIDVVERRFPSLAHRRVLSRQ
jgi:dTMP kinase